MGTHEISREEFHKILAEKDDIIEKQQQQIDWLMSQFKLLKQKQYGSSSETIDSDQLHLFNEAEVSADFSKPEPKLTEVKAHYRKRTRLTTDRIFRQHPDTETGSIRTAYRKHPDTLPG